MLYLRKEITLSIKLVFKEAARVFKKNVAVIAALFLMMYVPVALLNSFAMVKLDNSEKIAAVSEELKREDITEEEKELAEAVFADELSKQSVYLLAVALVSVLSSAFSLAIIKLSADESAGCDLGVRCEFAEGDVVIEAEYDAVTGSYTCIDEEKRDYQYYFSEAVRCLPRYIFAVLFSALMVMLGMFFFVIPGIIAAIITAFVPYVVALTGFRSKAAFSFASTVISKNHKLLALYAISIIANFLLTEASSFVMTKLAVGNVYGEFAIFTGLSCIMAFATIIFTVALAVAFSYAIENSPQLKEIVAVGNRFEEERKARKEQN